MIEMFFIKSVAQTICPAIKYSFIFETTRSEGKNAMINDWDEIPNS